MNLNENLKSLHEALASNAKLSSQVEITEVEEWLEPRADKTARPVRYKFLIKGLRPVLAAYVSSEPVGFTLQPEGLPIEVHLIGTQAFLFIQHETKQYAYCKNWEEALNLAERMIQLHRAPAR